MAYGQYGFQVVKIIRPDGVLELEESVTLGHGIIIHGRRIKSHAMIGVGSVIGFDVVVGHWGIVAEVCVVPQKIGNPGWQGRRRRSV